MRARLEELLCEAGVDIAGEHSAKAIGHLRCVLDAAGSLNLTSILDPDAAIRLHVVDSLLAAPVLKQAPRGRLIDIGSGAGYPGIPLSVASGRSTVLVEATRKKCQFLETCVSELALASVEVRCGRAEELARLPEMRGAFSAAISRALADLPVLLELSAPFLADGGHAISMKGRLDEKEIERGDRAGRAVGLERIGVRRYRLPGGDEERAIAVYQRLGEPSIELPRRVGLANKRPLG